MSKEERIKYVLGLLVEAVRVSVRHEIYTCYLTDNEISMREAEFKMIFDNYEIKPFCEDYNKLTTKFEGVEIYALTKKGIEPDDF